MTRKYKILILILTLLILLFSFLLASKTSRKHDQVKNRPITGNTVEATINEQMEEINKRNNLDLDLKDINKVEYPMSEKHTPTNPEVDYDLTDMPSDLIYLTVYRMMVEPQIYEGKKIRLEGSYYSGYYEPTGKYYHYCLVEDALACCAQGMEFILQDGEGEIYPDQDSYIVLEGTFETYKEDGDDSLYCRLKNASIIE